MRPLQKSKSWDQCSRGREVRSGWIWDPSFKHFKSHRKINLAIFIFDLNFVGWDLPGGPVVKKKKKTKTCLPAQGMQVWSLVRELRVHTLQSNSVHALQPQSPWTAATEPHVLQIPCPATREAWRSQWRPSTAKNRKCGNTETKQISQK